MVMHAGYDWNYLFESYAKDLSENDMDKIGHRFSVPF